MPRAKNIVSSYHETPVTCRREGITVLVGGLSGKELQRAALDSAREYGWNLVDLEIIRGVVPSDPVPKGALISSLSPSLHRQLRRIECPHVEIVPRYSPWPAEWPVVATDMVTQGALAADYFYGRGFRRVAYVGNDPWADAQPLYDAFYKRSGELGVSCELLQIKSPELTGKMTCAVLEQRERALSDVLLTLPIPVGVLTYHDKNASRICVAARNAGLAVPDDIAILGRGNDSYVCEVSPVRLSSIDYDDTGMIRQAAQLLQRLMQGEAAPKTPIMIPPRGIVERQSTDVLSVPDPDVVAALRYMWTHLDLDLSVNDVVLEVGVPRHRLERAFRRYLDRGINEELRRKRLEVFRKLLTATDKPISELARNVGFFTMVHLQRSFRRAYGMSPRQWRMRRKNGE